MKQLIIKGGRLLCPQQQLDKIGDLYLSQGEIVAIDKQPDNFVVDEIIDGKGFWVLPGLIDTYAHLGEPSYEQCGTLRSETYAAATAGITSLCCSPETTPVLDTPAMATLIRNKVQEQGMARVYPLAALTKGLKGEQLSELKAMAEAGCIAVTQAHQPIADSMMLRQCFAYSSNFSLPLFINPEEYYLGNAGCVHEGIISTRLGLPGIPSVAETIEVSRCLALAKETGAQIHFCKISAADTLHLLVQAKNKGLNVTAGVAAHHLELTEMDVSSYDSQCRVQPPLRSLQDQQLLLEGLQQGIIDVVCSDHRPLGADAKLLPFQEAAPGISALETLLPLLLRLVENKQLTLLQAVEKVTLKPAKILNLPQGRLTPGTPADIILLDPQRIQRFTKQQLKSKGKNTPFLDWEFKGQVVMTLLAGEVIFDSR